MLFDEVAAVVLGSQLLQALVHTLAHGGDTLTHGFYVSRPLGQQVRIRQDSGNRLTTVRRRVGVNAAHHGFQLAQYAVCFICVLAHHRQATTALGVVREILGEGVGQQERQARIHHGAHSESILIQAATKTLVGHVQERNQFALLQDGDQFQPLLIAQVSPRGVMTAGVQQHNAVLGQNGNVFHQAGEIQTTSGGIVIAISVGRDARSTENGVVVVPGRIADPHFAIGVGFMQEVATHFQCARTTQCLDSGHTAFFQHFAIRTKNQFLHGATVGSQTFDRQVASWLTLGRPLIFSAASYIQQRQTALLVVIQTNGQVDLAITWIGVKRLVQTENRIATIGLQMLKHACSLKNYGCGPPGLTNGLFG